MKRRAFFSRLIGGAAVAANPQAVTTLMQTAAPKAVTSSVSFCTGLMGVTEVGKMARYAQAYGMSAEKLRHMLAHKEAINRAIMFGGLK